jgi:3-phenylpropionate/trans-cinnamate dioxygenase ferredoxin reductase subunit
VVAAGDVARWAHPDYPHGLRVEHWTNATESGEAAANSLLMQESAKPYAPVPYFWSDQHGVKLQFVGHTVPGDEIRILDGAFADDRVVVAFGRDGRLVASLGIRRPVQVMTLQRLIGDKAPFPPEL